LINLKHKRNRLKQEGGNLRYSIEELQHKKEDQIFERKSARIDPKGMTNHIVAFANADGGTLGIGIEDDGTITGIDNFTERINEIYRIPFLYTIHSGNDRKNRMYR